MGPRTESARSSQEETTQRLARLLRHEVGDLLQSIYSTVAILLERLPADRMLERRLLTDLKHRAELCKYEMDAVVDLVSPPEFALARVDLTELVQAAVAHVRRRQPTLPVHLEAGGASFVHADPEALSEALILLLLAIAPAAQKQVHVCVYPTQTQAVCIVERDGYAVAAEQFGWLQQPFVTTQNALFGLALAQAQRIAQGHGGIVQAAQGPTGGVSVRLVLPVTGDA
jgi:signal transduction histidine kinase